MRIYILSLFVLFIIAASAPFIRAEVILDGTVGMAGQIEINGPDYNIRSEYGSQAGSNLFYSFEQFNISLQETATFSGPSSVENIISRITGGELSTIDGLIRSTIPGADLYLLNPAGILFGSEATIDLTGSLHTTTADYLKMSQNEKFYASPVQGEILSSAPPSAFGFLGEPSGSITFDGSKINLTGETLSAIGGNIAIKDNAQLTVNGGRLNLVAAAGEGEVSLSDSDLDTTVSTFGSISVTGSEAGRPSTLYANNGSLYIRGGRFVVDNGEILADTQFTTQSETGTIMDIYADSVNIKNNSLISTDTFGQDQGADLMLHATDTVTISDSNIRVGAIGAKATGNAGLLSIRGNNVYLDNNALIESESKGNAGGNAGDVEIAAHDQVSLQDSSINTYTTGSGDAGSVSITAGGVTLGEDSAIQTFTQGAGDAGDVSITADSIILTNGAVVKTETEERGEAGSITLSGRRIEVTENALVSSSSRAEGDAGQIVIKDADTLSLTRQAVIKTEADGSGNAGDIRVTASRLTVSSGSVLSSAGNAETDGGDAGDIFLDLSDALEMDNGTLRTDAVSSGGGKILVNTQKVSLSGSEITTSVHQGDQKGGDIQIGDPKTGQGPASVVLNHSTIKANADEGDGGAIFIVTDAYIQSADSRVEASSRRGNDGSIRIEAPDEDMISGLAVLPTNFLDASRWVKNPCSLRGAENISRFVVKSRDGIPGSYDDYLSSPPGLQGRNTGDGESGLSAFFRAGDFPGLIEALNRQGVTPGNAALLTDAYTRIGQYKKALKALYGVLPSLKESPPSVERTACFNAFADLFLALGNNRGAIDYVKKALADARKVNDSYATASALNHLGNIRAAAGNGRGAVSAYEEGLRFLRGSREDTDVLAAVITINRGRLACKSNNPDAAKTACDAAMTFLKRQSAAYFKGAGFIALGLVESKRAKNFNHDTNAAFSCFQKALNIGDTIENHDLVSAASGYSGKVFETRTQFPEARKWTEKAILEAQAGGNTYHLYQWQWQSGRLYSARGDIANAVQTYRAAMITLKSLRMEFLNGFRDRQHRFEKNVRQMYMELASLLIARQANLEEAIDTLETMKTAELQNYYQDECLASRLPEAGEITPATLPPKTALIYLLPMPDTLGILFMSQNGIRSFRTPLSLAELHRTVDRFIGKLREADEDIMTEASGLYQWLIRPIESALHAQAIRTLVMVPSGSLRLIPFAALHDGDRFLIEKYALATIPAIRLTNLAASGKNEMSILLNGLSEGRGGLPPLFNVSSEIQGIRAVLGRGNVLMDRAFTIENLEKEFLRYPYDIVHMATHAVFGNTPDETFLLTYDGKLTMTQLEHLISAGQVLGNPLELLTLSACETAAGGETADFGLAGVAVKAGAKSALATLWPVDDRAAGKALNAFYSRLAIPGTTKAEALRQAQQALIKEPVFSHPSSWAPFLLIGNWQ